MITYSWTVIIRGVLACRGFFAVVEKDHLSVNYTA